MTEDIRICRLKSLEFGEFELRPGDSMRVGRHKENEIVLDDSSVSRFHVRITWDPGARRPTLFDNGSQNGTYVDEEKVQGAKKLQDKVKIAIGPFVLRVHLENCSDQPAILTDTTDMVTLFTDDGPDVEEGVIAAGVHSVRELMERFENDRRTGTLKIDQAPPIVVTYCLGRIMSADIPTYGRGLRALERVLSLRSGNWRFTRELEPQEDAMNLWVSDFLRAREKSSGDDTEHGTQRFKSTHRIRRLFDRRNDE